MVLRTIRVSHVNRNSDLVTRLRILRDGHRDLTGLLVNLHTIRRVLTRSELRALRSFSRVAVFVLELRSRNRRVLTRLTRTILIAGLELLVVLDFRDSAVFVLLGRVAPRRRRALREGVALGGGSFDNHGLAVPVDVLTVCVRRQLLTVNRDLVLDTFGLLDGDERRLITGSRVISGCAQ